MFSTYECKTDEVIRYLDVTSLYPSVLVKNPYPLGHPKVITEFESKQIDNYFGFIKCKVLPPKNLYIPVLPIRDQNKKLLFPLCAICANEKGDKCKHTPDQRALVGTWFSEELKLALTKHYVIKEIYEVLHYEQKSHDLFQPYIQTWLKYKTEASGWPMKCDTDEKKNEFIREFKEREGVDLDREKMVKNPGLRSIAKLMLNSLWGKLGQRRNQGQTSLFSKYWPFYRLISDAKIKIKGILSLF